MWIFKASASRPCTTSTSYKLNFRHTTQCMRSPKKLKLAGREGRFDLDTAVWAWRCRAVKQLDTLGRRRRPGSPHGHLAVSLYLPLYIDECILLARRRRSKRRRGVMARPD